MMLWHRIGQKAGFDYSNLQLWKDIREEIRLQDQKEERKIQEKERRDGEKKGKD